jgi:pyruvate formate lyase activating enzyme
MTLGYYQSFESFALVDGPGVRSVLFLEGCPFRCLFCHNPDTWEFKHTHPITAQEAFDKMIRYKPYWKDREHGGITVSGGEPLAQLDFLIEFCKLAHNAGIHVTIDTSGATFSMNETFLAKFDELLKNIDLIMLDIKCIDSEVHKKLTGKDNANVLDMFRYLDSKNFPIWIRHVLVPGITDNDELLIKTDAFIKSLHNVERVEILPYHTLGIHKYEILGLKYPLKGVVSPTQDRIKNAEALLHVKDYQGYLKK